MLAFLFLFALVFFVLCYRYYGRFLARKLNVDDNVPTPADTHFDGVDYCPAHPAVLLGHHFSSIAGAGPIVGPIAAASWFGWLPTYIWCLIGSAFLGGPHDAGSLIASIRHEGKSMGEVVRQWTGKRGYFLFLSFCILCLFLVIAVFLQLAAKTLADDPAVAFAGVVYTIMALLFGLFVYRLKLSFKLVTLFMLPIVFGSCWAAQTYPQLAAPFIFSVATWRWILIGYIVAASLLPVWLLLQPRDYLASWFLYVSVLIGGIGMIAGFDFEITLPAFKSFEAGDALYIWPILFVTVACGAISGFHAIVGSGTSSKQLRRESDSLIVGYGSMLIEGMIAVIAIGIVMIGGTIAARDPIAVYAEGFGRFSALIGMNPRLGASLGALAINIFILTSLDTATRLTRYQIEEISGGRINRYVATFLAVAGGMVLLLSESGGKPTWMVIWPLFGSSNQLVAALVLLGLAVWVKKALKKNNAFLMVPMCFMLLTALGALVLLIRDQWISHSTNWLVIGICWILIILALLMTRESFEALKSEPHTLPPS